MANETTPADFETVLKEEAERYNLTEDTIRKMVREQLTAQVASKLVEKIVAGEVTPPEELTSHMTIDVEKLSPAAREILLAEIKLIGSGQTDKVEEQERKEEERTDE